MITTAGINNNVLGNVVYMAMELSQNKWCLAFGNGVKLRQVTLDSHDRLGLFEAIDKAKEKFGLEKDAKVLSCYEAGRDGFWIHRWLTSAGIENIVIDSSSIKVDRKNRRAKTDRLDASQMLKQLILHVRGVLTYIKFFILQKEDYQILDLQWTLPGLQQITLIIFSKLG